MRLKKYQNYISLYFIKTFLMVSFIFFCITIIINIFEEIRFAEKYNAEMFFSIYLSLLNAPTLMFEILPFIFLISAKIFYISLNEKNEIEILNSNGIGNLKIVFILSIISALIGIFVLLFYYSLSSNLKSKYLEIKNKFSNSNEYLAVVNDEGLWIKEQIEENLYIIHAEKFDKNSLKLVTITESDKYFSNKNTINAKSADITSKNWKLYNVSTLNNSGSTKNYKTLVYNSSFNGEIISNLFSNLNSLNIYELHNLAESYLKIGYSNKDIKMHLNKIYSMPIFYILMTLLGFVIITKLKKLKSKFFVVIFGIFISVVVYYLNYFSSILGNNGTLPVYLSIWVPLIILFLLCNIGLLKINEN